MANKVNNKVDTKDWKKVPIENVVKFRKWGFIIWLK